MNPACKPDQRLRRSAFRLWVFGWLVCVLIQTGTLGEVNTSQRLRATRWIWQNIEQANLPGWTVSGRDGKGYVTAGIGQSLVMLPADILFFTFESRISNARLQEKLREGFVAYLTFPPLCATAVLLAFLTLAELGHSLRASLWGALALLLGSSFLHYSQDHEENGLMVLLGLAILHGLLVWRRTNQNGPLILAAAASGFGLLVRLPFLAVPVGLTAGFLAIAWQGEPGRRRELIRCVAVLATGLAAGFFFDRLYHHHRFGTWWGTYFSVADSAEAGRPAGWLMGGNFWEGFWGPLITPQRSLFAYDPLLLLCFPAWHYRKALPRPTVVLLWISLTATFLVQVCFYARYIAWEGAGAWANRHTLVPVNLLVPLIAAAAVDSLPPLYGWRRAILLGLLGWNLTVQAASVIYPDALETYGPGVRPKPGGIEFERPVFMVGRRLYNIWEGLHGRINEDEVGRQFHRVCLAPAIATREFPKFGPAAWSVWSVLLVATTAHGFHLIRAIRRPLGTP